MIGIVETSIFFFEYFLSQPFMSALIMNYKMCSNMRIRFKFFQLVLRSKNFCNSNFRYSNKIA